jgi:hypothetical protein
MHHYSQTPSAQGSLQPVRAGQHSFSLATLVSRTHMYRWPVYSHALSILPFIFYFAWLLQIPNQLDSQALCGYAPTV